MLFFLVRFQSIVLFVFFFFSSRRRHTRCGRDWSSDVCSSDLITTYFLVPVPRGETGEERMERLGLELWVDGDRTIVDMVEFGSLAADIGFDFDQEIIEVLAPVDRWAKELMWIPGFLLFGLVVLLQRRRKQVAASPEHAV